MKVVYVVPSYAPSVGGIQRHVGRLAGHMADVGHVVEVLTQERDQRLARVEMVAGVTVRRFPVVIPSQHYAFAPSLWRYLARHHAAYDIVHAHGYHALPALGAAFSGHHLIFTPHYHGTGHSPFRRLLHRPYHLLGHRIFQTCLHIICVSQSEAALVSRHFPLVASRISVIPNGIDVFALRAAQPYPTEGRLVLCGGRLEHYKQIHRVISALGYLDPAFQLRVVGDGPARRMLEKLVTRHDLTDRVRFLGHLDDLDFYRWLRTASVYVTMSSQEAFGLTLREAMVAGAGVVASDIPAHREIAADAATLLPLDASPRALADAIRATASRPIGAVRTATWDEVAGQTLLLYRRAVGSSSYSPHTHSQPETHHFAP